MTLPPEILDDLAAFKAKLPTVVRKRRRMKDLKGTHPDEKPPFFSEIKPTLPKTENVRRNGKGCWLVMVPQPLRHASQAHAYQGVKSREDPVVRDAPITKALETKAANVAGTTARICNDAALFKGKK